MSEPSRFPGPGSSGASLEQARFDAGPAILSSSDALAAVPPAGAAGALASSFSALAHLPLIDSLGRVHRSLRISVTDRCNIRCQYCMPEIASFLPSDRLLSFAQITRFVELVTLLGIREVRITGGEPLMRPKLAELLRSLTAIDRLDGIALTTNGMMLADQLPELVQAGLRRVNISLDTLNEETFRRLSRREGLNRVLAGIDAAVREPRLTVRLNALVMREVNWDEVLDLVDFARERSLTLRFIEFMPLDAERAWNRQQMVSGDEMRSRLSARYGALLPLERRDPSQPSTDYTFSDGLGAVGFIDSVSKPFCSSCDRLRLTADGKLRNCLFGQEEWDVRPLLSEDRLAAGAGASESASALQASEILAVVRACIAAKRAAHGIDASGFLPPERAMFQIGG